jgi:hypothetical protein
MEWSTIDGNQQQGNFDTMSLQLRDFDGILRHCLLDSISPYSPTLQDRRNFRIIPSLEDPGVLHWGIFFDMGLYVFTVDTRFSLRTFYDSFLHIISVRDHMK